MVRMGLRRGLMLSAEDVAKVRDSTPFGVGSAAVAALRRIGGETPPKGEGELPADRFFDECLSVAEYDLPKAIQELCVRPEPTLAARAPWYFSGIVAPLSELQGEDRKRAIGNAARTSIRERVESLLDETLSTRSLTVIQGPAGLGVTTAAQTWCAVHAGQARFASIPPGKIDKEFFAALADSYGLPTNMKAAEIKARVGKVARESGLMLVLDSADWLFYQTEDRHARIPERVDWIVTTLRGMGVAVALLASPSFFLWKSRAETWASWDSRAFVQGIFYEKLPDRPLKSDLEAVALFRLPGVSRELVKDVAALAHLNRSFTDVEKVVSRARLLAGQRGMDVPGDPEVSEAISANYGASTALQEEMAAADAEVNRSRAAARRRQGRGRAPAELPQPIRSRRAGSDFTPVRGRGTSPVEAK